MDYVYVSTQPLMHLQLTLLLGLGQEVIVVISDPGREK